MEQEQTKEETMQQALFQPIGVDPEPVVEEPAPDPNQEKIAALEAQIAEQNKRMQEQNDNMLKMMSQRPQQTVQQVQPAPQETPQAPDVLEDPEGYAKFVNEQAIINANKIVEEKTTQLTTRYDNDKKYEKLFGKFKEKEPDLSNKNYDLIEFIATKKVKEVAAQGLDVNSYIFGNEDKFVDDVLTDVKNQLGLATLDDNDRTDGLTTTPNLTVKPAKKPDQNTKSFVDSMKELRYRGR